jgi:SRSO17 transposase
MFPEETTEGRPMSLQDIAGLGKLLGQFLSLFADCFRRPAGRLLLAVYVRGLLSNVQRKNVEAMALAQGVAVRTLQRFLESIRWDEERLRDRCQQLVAAEHADPEALGVIDETGTTKSGGHTAGVKRQYNGNRGKVENCVNTVALSYASANFHCLLDARLYLPQEWASDPVRRKKTTFPRRSSSKRSPRSRSLWWTVRWPTASV